MVPCARWLAPALTAAAVAALLTACVASTGPAAGATATAAPSATPAPTAAPFGVRGTISVPIHLHADDPPPVTGKECEAAHEFGDIMQGGRVVLKDATGGTAGIGRLRAGKARVSTKSPELSRCEFGFAVTTVSSGSRTYRLGVGDAERGTVEFSRKELEAGPTITLG
jgi:hypothetical protein